MAKLTEKYIERFDGSLIKEKVEFTTKNFKGQPITYKEKYYLDYAVDEETGNLLETFEKNYTESQMKYNMNSMKSAFNILKGGVSVDEIVDFREKYKISAYNLSLILGFSKNTITNIENDGGAPALPTSRFIKQCLNDLELLINYLKDCNEIEDRSKNKMLDRLLSQ